MATVAPAALAVHANATHILASSNCPSVYTIVPFSVGPPPVAPPPPSSSSSPRVAASVGKSARESRAPTNRDDVNAPPPAAAMTSYAFIPA